MTALARAPGKLLLSGAYSVLYGAPAIVTAVSRYVVADALRTSALVTEEVAAALRSGSLAHAPWFDASALRSAPDANGQTRKLGLGSSAAITAASLASARGAAPLGEAALRDLVFPLALAAHRAAQPDGSGVDVAASVFGGTLLCRLAADRSLDVRPFPLPPGLAVRVFALGSSASTAELVARVRRYAAEAPGPFAARVDEAMAGAQVAADASTAEAFVGAARAQFAALAKLGDAAGVDIVPEALRELGRLAERKGGAFGPSGAGGGDVAMWFGVGPPPEPLLDRARALGLVQLDVAIGASGLHLGS